MTVVVKKHDDIPLVRSVENKLSTFQHLVGGNIEIVRVDDYLMICNEEGKLLGLPENVPFNCDVICGDIVFVGCDEDGEFCDITPEQMQDIVRRFSCIATDGDVRRISKLWRGDD